MNKIEILISDLRFLGYSDQDIKDMINAYLNLKDKKKNRNNKKIK